MLKRYERHMKKWRDITREDAEVGIMDDSITRLKEAINSSDNIVFFGGAGVSTESGIPDFRSADGVYNMKYKYPPEMILSHTFFLDHTEEFYEFYKAKLLHPDATPNRAHYALAELERQGRLKAVITQNVDALHSKAGSVNVLELHGSCERNYCTRCGRDHALEAIIKAIGIPICECGGIIKPDVVLFEESLDERVISASITAIRGADMLIVGGTSLNVYPAAGMIQYFRGGALVLINKSETMYDRHADIVIHESIGETLGSAAGIA